MKFTSCLIQERIKQEESLNLLKMMVISHIDKAKQRFINSGRNDQEIHSGTVVEKSQQVSIAISNKTNSDLH